MRSDNVFQVGREVTGESFIGRKNVLNDFKDRFLSGSTNRTLSLVGLTRVGKSSVIANALDEETIRENGMIYVHIVLTECESYIEFLKMIVAEIESGLSFFYGECDDYLQNQFSRAAGCPLDDESYPILNSTIKNILKKLSRMDRHLLLVIDEFDGAGRLFGGKKSYFEFLRTISSSAKFKVSTILVSRRSLHVIEECSPENSTFHGVFDRLTLNGFDENDMEAYYSVLAGYGIILTPEQKEMLHYYCGRLPFLLSVFGFHLVQNKLRLEADTDIKDIFSTNSPFIIEYYEDIRKQLERDKHLEKLIGIVLGPQIDISSNDVEILNAMGLLDHDGTQYYTVCPHFTDYIRSLHLSFPIWEELLQVEKFLKRLVDREMPGILHTSPGSWQKDFWVELIRNDDYARSFSIIPKTVEKFQKSTYRDFHVEASVLDVISMYSVTKLIRRYWDNAFSRYFYEDSIRVWSDKFDLCAIARNPLAHGHENYLTAAQKRLVDVYCKEIMESIQSAFGKVST